MKRDHHNDVRCGIGKSERRHEPERWKKERIKDIHAVGDKSGEGSRVSQARASDTELDRERRREPFILGSSFMLVSSIMHDRHSSITTSLVRTYIYIHIHT